MAIALVQAGYESRLLHLHLLENILDNFGDLAYGFGDAVLPVNHTIIVELVQMVHLGRAPLTVHGGQHDWAVMEGVMQGYRIQFNSLAPFIVHEMITEQRQQIHGSLLDLDWGPGTRVTL